MKHMIAALPILLFACSPGAREAVTTPGTETKADDGKSVYTTYCANCHGATAKGDGPGAAGLTPKPTDLTQHRTGPPPSGKTRWEVILTGSDDTAMQGFGTVLSETQLEQLHGYLSELVHGTDGAAACDSPGQEHRGRRHRNRRGHGADRQGPRRGGPAMAANAESAAIALPLIPGDGPDKHVQILLETPAIKLVAITLREGKALGEHSAPVTVTIQAVTGSGTVTIGDRSEPLSAERMIVLPPGVSHDVVPDGEHELVLLVHYLKNAKGKQR